MWWKQLCPNPCMWLRVEPVEGLTWPNLRVGRLSAGKSNGFLEAWSSWKLEFFCIIVISFFTMLKNGLTHGCGRLWGFAADHLFWLLAVINSFSYFLLLLRYFGKKCSWWHWRTSKSLIIFFFPSEKQYAVDAVVRRELHFVLDFLNGNFCLWWTSRRTRRPVISFPPPIHLLPAFLPYCNTATNEGCFWGVVCISFFFLSWFNAKSF